MSKQTLLFEKEYSIHDIHCIALKIWGIINTQKIKFVCFKGEIGAGKTTLISQLCSLKDANISVTSPTYTLLNTYHYYIKDEKKTIFHLDFYRLKNEQDFYASGIDDLLQNGDFIFIEWTFLDLIAPPYLLVDIKKKIDYNIRNICIYIIP